MRWKGMWSPHWWLVVFFLGEVLVLVGQACGGRWQAVCGHGCVGVGMGLLWPSGRRWSTGPLSAGRAPSQPGSPLAWGALPLWQERLEEGCAKKGGGGVCVWDAADL